MIVLRIAAGSLLAAILAAGNAAAQAPENDHFLAATPISPLGVELPRDTVTMPVNDTAGATLQADLFSPPGAGGPPEPGECGGVAVDRSVWYRFQPDVAGRARLEAIGFDSTLALLPLASADDPAPQDFVCSNGRDDTIERLERTVAAGTVYAVQVAGAGGASGLLQLSLTFVPDRDGDGVQDDEDACPNRRGSGADGCLLRMNLDVPWEYEDATGGARFLFMHVIGAPRGARAEVRCSRGCSRIRVRVRKRVTRIRAFTGRYMPAGSRVEVRVTKPGYIGEYRAFTVTEGDVASEGGCLPPGADRPRRRCR